MFRGGKRTGRYVISKSDELPPQTAQSHNPHKSRERSGRLHNAKRRETGAASRNHARCRRVRYQRQIAMKPQHKARSFVPVRFQVSLTPPFREGFARAVMTLTLLRVSERWTVLERQSARKPLKGL